MQYLQQQQKNPPSSPGWWWRRWRWRPVKVRPRCQWWWRQTSQEKGQPLRFFPFSLVLTLLQLQFSVEVQVKGYRSRVTPGKMSVSAQSSLWFYWSTSIICPVMLFCCFLFSHPLPICGVKKLHVPTERSYSMIYFVFRYEMPMTSDGRNALCTGCTADILTWRQESHRCIYDCCISCRRDPAIVDLMELSCNYCN